MNALSNLIIDDYRELEAGDQIKNITEYLQNTQLHEDEKGLTYSKLGGLYFVSGVINFDEETIDVLPEPSLNDAFFNTVDGEKLLLKSGQTTLTAPVIGEKIVSGFYAIEEN